MPVSCPTTEQLSALLRSVPDADGEAALGTHLAGCPSCRARLDALAGGSDWVEARARAHRASPPLASESLQRAIEALDAHAAGTEPHALPPVRPDFLQPSAQAGALGRIGSYEVLEQVASGGMGIVLKALDPGLNRIVALKVLPPALAANGLARARFIREARAAAAVMHEHVVPIYAVDEAGGLPYLVMQFVQGRTLAERIRTTAPLRLEELLRIGAQAAMGLAAAHAQGLVHRDVKPGNILLENGVERVKITDFGLARALDDASLTREGYIAGTPEYMSPEQASGGVADQRSDLFGLGCVLYEMATGISPFRSEKPLVAMRRVCDEKPPSVQVLNPRCPAALSQLIEHLLAKDPAARPPSATGVAVKLERWLAELQQSGGSPCSIREPTSASSPRSRSFHPMIWGVAILLGLTLVWAGLLGLRPVDKPETGLPGGALMPSEAIFFLPTSTEAPGQGFPTLAAAVAAAKDGSVIECRFNGFQGIPTLRLDRPLVIRAGAGFEPVLASTSRDAGLLATRAPLAIEGLTLITHPSPPGPDDERPGRHGFAVLVEGAPLLVTHCRFEIEGTSAFPRRRPPSLRVMNTPLVVIRHCVFAARRGIAIEWIDDPDFAADPAPRLDIEGSTVTGGFLSLGGRPLSPLHVVMRRNTFHFERLLGVVGEATATFMRLSASENLFAGKDLFWTFRAQNSPLRELLHWQGDGNVYDVQTYAAIRPAVTRHETWVGSEAVIETNSITVELGIHTRLTALTAPTPEAEASALALTQDDLQRLKEFGWTASHPPGADPGTAGPGRPYHAWRDTPAHAAWMNRFRPYAR